MISQRIADNKATLRVQGRFDFSVHSEFRSTMKAAIGDAAVRGIAIDLSGVDYIDSSALGMLLLSRENAQQAGKTIELLSPSGPVQQVLAIANFQKLFDIR